MREDVGAMIFRNVDNSLLIDTASHQRRIESSATTLWGRHAMLLSLNADISPLTQLLHSGSSNRRLFLPTSELSSHLVIFVCLYNGVQLTSKLRHTRTLSATAWPHRYLVITQQYTSSTFDLIAFSYLQGKIQGASEECYYSFYVFKTTFLETCRGQGVSAL